MAGFDHAGNEPQQLDDAPTAKRNARVGLQLFTVYFLVYAGFVLLNAFWPRVMEWTPVAGINLAILYGLLLIVGALLMSFLYGWLCQSPVPPPSESGDTL